MIRAALLLLVLSAVAAAKPVPAPAPLPTQTQVQPEPLVRMSFVRGYTRKDGRYVSPHWRAIKVRRGALPQ